MTRRAPCVAVLTRLRAFEARVRLGEFAEHGVRMEQGEDQRYIVDLRREGRIDPTIAGEHLVWDVPHSTYAVVCGEAAARLFPSLPRDDIGDGACLDCLAAAREQIIKIRERLDEPTDF